MSMPAERVPAVQVDHDEVTKLGADVTLAKKIEAARKAEERGRQVPNEPFQQAQKAGMLLGNISFAPRSTQIAKWAMMDAKDVRKGFGGSLGCSTQGSDPKALTNNLKNLLHDVWKLDPPSVLISITGGGEDVLLSATVQNGFRRGLLQAVETTKAWVITGGTDSGVMQLVGKWMRDSNAVCLGIAPWGHVAYNERLREFSQVPSQIYHYKLAEEFEPDYVSLEPSHSHFILVDDGSQGLSAKGTEVEPRRFVEETICPENSDEDAKIAIPKVVLVIGGDKATLRTALGALQDDRPVVLLPESGGAAKQIYSVIFEDCLEHGGASDFQPEELQLLQAIVDANEAYTVPKSFSGGINVDRAVSFFSVDEPMETEPLRDVLLRAMLDDLKDNPTDSIRLAVTWKDPAIIRQELADLRTEDPRGMILAFQHGLSMAEVTVLEALVESSIDCSKIRLNDLVIKEEGIAQGGRRKSQVGVDPKGAGSGGQSPLEPNLRKLDKLHHLVAHSPLKCPERAHKDSTYGFMVLAQHLEPYFNYESNFMRFRYMRHHGVDKQLKPSWTDLTLWAVLAGQPAVAKLLWAQTADPLRIALMSSLLCQQLAGDQKGSQSDAIIEQAKEYERWALGMLNASNLDRCELATLLIAFPVMKDDKAWDGTSEMWPDSPFELAVGGNAPNGEQIRCEAFFMHRHVESFFQDLFDGFKLTAPEFDEEDEDEDNDVDGKKVTDAEAYFDDETNSWIRTDRMVEGEVPLFGRIFYHKEHSQCQRFLDFFSIPRIKFIVHNLFSLGYLILLVFQLNKGIPWNPAPWMYREGTLPTSASYFSPGIPYDEILNYIWALCRLIDEVKQMFITGMEEYEQSESWGLNGAMAYFASAGNRLDLFNLGVVLLIGLLRILNEQAYFTGEVCWPMACTPTDVFVLRLCQSMYAIVVVTIFMRFVSSLKYFRSFGVLYICVLRMSEDVVSWFSLTILITIGFGVSYAVLMPAASATAQTHANYLGRPFFQPFWGLLGDFDAESVFEYYSVEEFPAAVLMPIMLWVYNFLTSIVLVNLLIAQMGARYDFVMEIGEVEWTAERIELIKEYKDERDEMPAPLNVFRLFLLDIPRFVMKLAKGRKGQKESNNKPHQRNGFKLELRGPSIEHAKEAVQQLCEESLNEEDDEGEDTDGKLSRLLDQQRTLASTLEALAGEVAHIRTTMSNVGDKLARKATLEKRSYDKSKRRRTSPTKSSLTGDSSFVGKYSTPGKHPVEAIVLDAQSLE